MAYTGGIDVPADNFALRIDTDCPTMESAGKINRRELARGVQIAVVDPVGKSVKPYDVASRVYRVAHSESGIWEIKRSVIVTSASKAVANTASVHVPSDNGAVRADPQASRQHSIGIIEGSEAVRHGHRASTQHQINHD